MPARINYKASTQYEPSPFQNEIKQLIRDGKTVKECLVLFPQAKERTVFRYQEEVRAEKKDEQGNRIPEEKPGAQKVVKETEKVNVAVATTKTPGLIVFHFNGLDINVEFMDLLESWRYYNDVKVMNPAIDDSFSTFVRVSAKNLWGFFKEKKEKEVVVEILPTEGDGG